MPVRFPISPSDNFPSHHQRALLGSCFVSMIDSAIGVCANNCNGAEFHHRPMKGVCRGVIKEFQVVMKLDTFLGVRGPDISGFNVIG